MDNFSALLGKKLAGSGGGSGTSNYNELENKPQINGHTLNGNKTAANLGLQSVINQNNKLDADLLDDSESEKKLVSENDISNWNNKYDSDDAYTKAQTDAAITEAINGLDVAETGGAGQYISTISETNGKIEATPTTFDTALSSSSTNGNAPTSKTVFDDQQRQDALEAEDRAALIEHVDSGAKNLLINTAVTTTAANGLTYTVNADKSVTVTGNASAYYAFTIAGSRTYANAMPLKKGTYIIKAGIAYDSSKPIFVQFGVMTSSEASISWQNIYDTNKELVVNNDTTRIVYELYNPSGSYSGYNATFYPMICTAADWAISQKFVPYARTNRELTVLMDEDRASLVELVDNGAKNLLKNELGSGTKSGLAYTTRTDGSIVITGGTATGGNADFVIPFTPKESGQYVLQGCPSGGSGETYKGQIVLYPSMTNVAAIFDNTSVTATLTGGTQYAYRFRVYNGKAISNSTIYPMVCSKAAWDISHQYEPYALPNPVITPALIEQVDGGAKNICNWTANTSTISGVTFTINDDKTVSTSGTATVRSQKALKFNVPSTLKAGRYVLYGCPNGGEQSGEILYCLYIWDYTTNARVCSDDTGGCSEFDWIPDASHLYAITVDVRSGANVSGLIFRPMICTAADWAVSQKFVPYRPSWQEMWEMIQALQSGGASTQSVQPALMSAAKPLISAEETSEKEAEPDEVSEIEEKENVKDETETS